MNKLGYLTKYSLKKKISSKWFWVANIILCIALIALVNLDSIITFFGGDFSKSQEVIVIDQTGNLYNEFKTTLDSTEKVIATGSEFKVKQSKKTLKQEKKKIDDKIIVVLSDSSETILDMKVISQTKISDMTYQLIYQSLATIKYNYGLANSNIDPTELAYISTAPSIERVVLNDKNSIEDNMDTIMGTVFPTVILPFFMLIIILVQMIGAEINEEKSTRSMEIIISNVSPRTHFFSKIFAANIFVIGQGLLLLIYSGIGLIVRMGLDTNSTTSVFDSIKPMISSLQASGFMGTLSYVIPITLVLMLLSFLAYSLLAGILASMTTTMEDFQQIQTPIVFLLLAGYYLAIMASVFDGSAFIRILSYIPFISCLLSPALLVIGQITVIDACIAIALLILTNYLGVKYGLRIYKVGILNYSNEKIWKRVKKIVNTKEL